MVMTNIAIENHHVSWENPLFLWIPMAIFYGYVCLPEVTSSWNIEVSSLEHNHIGCY